MSFIRFEKVERKDRLNRKQVSTFILASCEQCDIEFKRKIRTRYNTAEKCANVLFYCNKECQNLAKTRETKEYLKVSTTTKNKTSGLKQTSSA